MNWNDPEIIIAGLAAIVSFISLSISIKGFYESKKHNEAILRPKLDFSSQITPKFNYATVSLINKGLGPAIIKSFDFYIDEKHVKKELGLNRFEELTKELKLPEQTIFTIIEPVDQLLSQDSYDLVAAPLPVYDELNTEKIRAAFRRISIVINYTSEYGSNEVERYSGAEVYPSLEK